MKISLQQAAGILALPDDEVMYLHQQGRLKAGIDEESMKWQFEINEVLEMKKELDREKAKALLEMDADEGE